MAEDKQQLFIKLDKVLSSEADETQIDCILDSMRVRLFSLLY